MNVMILDFADSPKLRGVFSTKEIGAKMKLKFEVRIMSKYPEGVKLSIEKVITESEREEEEEIKPTLEEPVMATMKKKKRKDRGMSGPHDAEDEMLGAHNRPEQTAVNSQEPWRTAFA
jgi:hypothetical protein